MKLAARLIAFVTIAVACSGTYAQRAQPDTRMSFFVSSVGLGSGGNLGGLAGADAHCQKLATAAGAGERQWRAYLSGRAAGRVVHARDRIGNGPWFNARGRQMAATLADLHGPKNGIAFATALDEKSRRRLPGASRHLHRIECRRHTGHERTGLDVPQLDEQHLWNRDDWPPRQDRRAHVMELGAPDARMRSSEPAKQPG